MDDLAKILKNINVKADWIGLREVKEKNMGRFIRNGRPESNNTSRDHGVMVEVLVDGQFAYVATDHISISSIQKAAEQAVFWAKKAKNHSLFPFTMAHRPAYQIEYKGQAKKDLSTLNVGEVNDILCLCSDRMKKGNGIINAEAQVMMVETETRLVSSNGTDNYSKINLLNYTIKATAMREGQSQTRSFGNVNQIGAEGLNKDFLLAESERVRDEALELLLSEECPNESLDLLLAPDQMVLQIHESIGHPLELDRILGDERNYAGWSFVKPSDFGTLKYGSKNLNISFDPTVPGLTASYLVDDNGIKAEKEYLIKDGILLRGLGGVESQARLGIPGVACSRATSWNRAPIDRMANVNLEAGDSTMEKMISSVDHGMIMFTNRSWSIDDYRNKFQFGCEYAKLIKNGKIIKTIKNPNYRGVSTPFWNNLKMVGDESTYGLEGSFYCGKGEPNQIIRVGHGTPACLFENVEVFGGN